MALSIKEGGNVLILRSLKEAGIAMMVISHDINYVYSMVGRIVVLEKFRKGSI